MRHHVLSMLLSGHHIVIAFQQYMHATLLLVMQKL